MDYTECHAFAPVVRIGSPRPLTGGDTLACGEMGAGEPIFFSDEGTDTMVL